MNGSQPGISDYKKSSHIVTNRKQQGKKGYTNLAFLNKQKNEGAEVQPIIEMKGPEFLRT